MFPQTAALGLGLLAIAGPAAQAQLIDFSTDATLDRWMYPFNGTPGTRLSASTFGIPRLEGFDDHDAQFILGFRTDSAIPTGLDASQYRIISVRVSATVSNDQAFRFDATYDPHFTYQNQEGHYPHLQPDTTPGRPVKLWGVGYRDGFTLETWQETSPFGFNPTIPPSQEARTAYIAVFDPDGTPSDASNNLKQEVDLTPMAIGQTDAVAPGVLVPADTTFTFDVDICQPGVRAYLQQSLAAGEPRFGISSLHEADGGPDGGAGPVAYPIWYTRENPIAQIFGYVPHMEIEVRVGNAGDYNGDGVRNFFDISDFLRDFNAGNLAADMNGDCVLNFFDISIFLNEFNNP